MNDSVPPAEGPAEPSVPETALETVVEPGYDDDPAAPAPLNVPRVPTGDADHLATDGHVQVYEDVHRGLRDTLTALDARPGPPAPPTTYGNRS